jgi:hypothetical protein
VFALRRGTGGVFIFFAHENFVSASGNMSHI